MRRAVAHDRPRLGALCGVTTPVREVNIRGVAITMGSSGASPYQSCLLPRQKERPANDQPYSNPFSNGEPFPQKKNGENDGYNHAQLVDRSDFRHFTNLQGTKVTEP